MNGEQKGSNNKITTKAIIEIPNDESNVVDDDAQQQATTNVDSRPTTSAEGNANVQSQLPIQNDSQQLQLEKSGVKVKRSAKVQTISLNEIVVQQVTLPASSSNDQQSNGSFEGERSCWICFATEEDNTMATWVRPCKCRGSTKWVHQTCLYRWVDEKQKGNALRSVSCQQCQTEYIIVFPQMGKMANILEAFDNLIKRLSPFLAAGVLVGSLYWTAVTYGAVTFLQIVGHKKGLALMENGDPLILLIGLPAIPVALILIRMIRWEDAVIRLIRSRHSVARKLPLISFIMPYPEEAEENSAQNPPTPTLSDPVSATRIFCGALLLPTISTIVGRLLFESVENSLHRALLGGLTFVTVKGILKIYLKQQQYIRRKKRRIVDYTEENIRIYGNRNNNTNAQGQYLTAAASVSANENVNARHVLHNETNAVENPASVAEHSLPNINMDSRDSVV